MSTEGDRLRKAIEWGRDRLEQCRRTQRNSMLAQSRDWAYGESVAIKVMLAILEGELDP